MLVGQIRRNEQVRKTIYMELSKEKKKDKLIGRNIKYPRILLEKVEGKNCVGGLKFQHVKPDRDVVKCK